MEENGVIFSLEDVNYWRNAMSNLTFSVGKAEGSIQALLMRIESLENRVEQLEKRKKKRVKTNDT